MSRLIPTGLVLLAACSQPRPQPAPVLSSLDVELHRRAVSNALALPDGRMAYAWVTNEPDTASRFRTYGRLHTLIGSRHAEPPDTEGLPVVDPESPPQLAVGAAGVLYLAWSATNRPDRVWESTGIRLARSTDGGASWESARAVGAGAPFGGYRNNHELLATPDGTLYVAWLDSRALSDGGEGIHVLTSRSPDGGSTWSEPIPVDRAPSCECCRVAIAGATDGTLYVAWRKILDGGVRDIVVSRSTDRGDSWSEPIRVHADGWVQEYCPDAGPALAVDDRGDVHVAWWTGREGSAGVRYARSAGGGGSFDAAVEMKTGPRSRSSHVQLAVSADTVRVVWDDGTLEAPRIALRASTNGGATFGPAEYLSPSGRVAAYPHIAAGPGVLEIVWNESGSSGNPSRRAYESTHPAWTAYDERGTPQIVRWRPRRLDPAWQVQHFDSTAFWIGLHTVDALVAWAAGSGGRVARTTDGGTSWSVISVPGADSLQFRDVHAFSADEAFVLSIGSGRSSRIYRTRDGGGTWDLSFRNEDPDAFFDCFSFWDPDRGFAFSDSHDGEFTLIRTTDGGDSWSRIDPSVVPDARPGEGAFAASGTCVTTRAGGLGWFATGASSVDTRVIRTVDYGESWHEAPTPIASAAGSEGISSVAFRDDRNGAVFGGDFSMRDSVYANFAVTSDGGATWTASGPVPLAGAVFAGAPVPGAPTPTWIAVAPTGSAVSMDDGASWIRIDSLNYWTVSIAGPDAGWAAGPMRISRLRGL